MAFLFKSKKHQGSAPSSSSQAKEVPQQQSSSVVAPPSQSPPALGTPPGHSREKDPEKDKEKEKDRDMSANQSPPTVGSWNNSISSLSSPPTPTPEQRSMREKPEQEIQVPRNGAVPQPLVTSPNANLYPWAQRRFHFTSNTTSNPFPRYGSAVNSVASKEGQIYIMGGLINGSMVKGDLWMVETDGSQLTCFPIGTTSEGPGPRVGHASLIIGNAFIVFGGDTKVDERDDLDDTLYLLNTATRQWSRAAPSGVRPAGRYGHTLNIIGSKLYVFGGQIEGHFFNDLVTFDLNALQIPGNQWELLIKNTADGGPQQGPVPAARTNHTIVQWNDRLYLFGGTNSHQWFNDVWTYEPRSNRWSQLDCIGYIPVPREGHAAALVGDVMYIFGGRTEDGNDLGDLAAFRISSRRWYTFQNMGPSPSPRSGHTMTAHGKKIIVMGGEPSLGPRDAEELSLVYVLDTAKIRYPDGGSSGGPGSRRPSGADRGIMPPGRPPQSRDMPAGIPEHRDPRRMLTASRESVLGGTPPPHPRAAEVNPPAGPGPSGGVSLPHRLPRALPTQAPSGPPPQQQAPPPRTNGVLPTPPASRAKPPTTRVERGMSPVADGSASAFSERDTVSSPLRDPPGRSEPAQQPASAQAPLAPSGRRTPTTATPSVAAQPARAVPPRAVAEDENVPAEHPSRSRSIVGRQQTGGKPDGAADAPSANPSSALQTPAPASGASSTTATAASVPGSASQGAHSRQGSTEATISHLQLQNETLGKELAAARKRNAWYASEMALARRAGYTPNPSDSPNLDAKAAETFGEKDRPLIEVLMTMRTELARVHGELEADATVAASKITEAENQRDIALSEAIYAKARLATNGGSQAGTPQLDSPAREAADREAERLLEVHRRLATSLAFQAELQSKVAQFEAEIKSERQARELAESLADAAEVRVADLDSYKQRTTAEMESLKAELHQAQKFARDEAAACAEATAAAKVLQSERDELKQRLEEALDMCKTHGAALETMREAVVASTEKANLLERRLETERHHQESAERKLRLLRTEHEEMSAELETVSRRLREAEELVEAHSAEAEKHRTAVITGLGQAVDRALGGVGNAAADERMVWLNAQIESCTALVRKSQAAADIAEEKLRAAEERIAGLEAYQEQMSREGLSVRRQLQASMKQAQALQAENLEIRAQLANQQLEANAIAVQHGALKDLLAERGINPAELRRSQSMSRQGSGSGTPDQTRLREMEQQLEASAKTQASMQTAFKAREQEAERVYRERLEQLQTDYQSAVHYVKGTEKMLDRIKQELSKATAHNARLQAELEQQTQRAFAAEQASTEHEREREEAPSSWERERQALREQIESLQTAVQMSAAQLEKQMDEVRAELRATQHERDTYKDTAQHVERELAILADQARADLEQLKRENALLESRAQDAEDKVVVLLDQLVSSVDQHRRRSQMPDANGTGEHHRHQSQGNSQQQHQGHRRDGSSLSLLSEDSALATSPARAAGTAGGSAAGILGSGSADTRNSLALDSLASELETLRSHWEATNRSHRQSHTFDFDRTPTAFDGADEYSSAIASWRKRLDLEEQEAAAAQKGNNGGSASGNENGNSYGNTSSQQRSLAELQHSAHKPSDDEDKKSDERLEHSAPYPATQEPAPQATALSPA